MPSPELSTILHRACDALAELPRERVWEAAQRCDLAVPCRDTSGLITEHKPFKQVYASGDELHRALGAHAEEAQIAALTLLTDIDEDLATNFLVELMRRDLSESSPLSFEGGIARAMGHVFPELAPRLPPRVLGELWLAGRMRMSAVPSEALSAIALSEIARACRDQRSFDIDEDRLQEEHQGFSDAGEVLAALETLVETPRFQMIVRLLRRLGELKHAPAIPILVRFALGEDPRYHLSATRALLEIGTAEALAPLARLIETPEALDEQDDRIPDAVEAVIRQDPASSFERLARYFAEPLLSTPAGLCVARAAIHANSELLGKDPRWLDLGVKMLDDERLATRAMLARYDKAVLSAALKRAGLKDKPRRTHPVPEVPRWLERYKAGEREEVWSEICALEDSVRDPAVLPEAQAVAREIMARVRQNLERIVAILQKKKYKFRKGAKSALKPPAPNTPELLTQMEELLERPLPLSLRAFHEVVGEVNLLEKVDAEYGDEAWFAEYGQYEPLAIAPIKEELAGLKQDKKHERAYPPMLRKRPRRVYLADDPAFKQWPNQYGNDRPVYLELLDEEADALAFLPRKEPEGEMVQTPSGAWITQKPPLPPPERVAFVAYLRRYIQAGGFLWFADASEEEVWRQRKALTEGYVPF